MRILVTGACGFVGATLASTWVEAGSGHEILGLDSFARPGSETNRVRLRRLGVRVLHGDLRLPSDLEALPPVDAVIDAAANPSVLAGVDGATSSRQLLEHNLAGTVNVLEYCRRHHAALVLLSTSRVYSIPPLVSLPLAVRDGGYEPAPGAALPTGVTEAGVSEAFSCEPPCSLYGSAKRASETLALEYGAAFGLPVFVDRCGVLAGAGQFGRPDQGIFAFWIHSWLRRAPLAYVGFDGLGHQVRDCLHPADLVPLLDRQLGSSVEPRARVVNVSGGQASATSLRQLSEWCRQHIGPHEVRPAGSTRPFDVPWLVLDSALAAHAWGWAPRTSREMIFGEILDHARRHPEWLELSASG